MLPNGNFEEPPATWAVVGNMIVGQNLLPKWTIGGLVEYVSSGDQGNGMLVVAPDNGHAVKLGNGGFISQRIQGLKKGSSYSLSFSVAKTCGKTENLNVTVTPYSRVFPLKTVYENNGWDTYAWGFKSVAETHELILRNPDDDIIDPEPDCGPLIDGVAIKEISPLHSKVVKGDLITNGNFNQGPHDYLNGSNGVLLLPSDINHSPLPGWIIESSRPSKYIDSAHFSVPKGRGAVELLSGLESVLSQTVDTLPGKSHRLSFAVGDARNKCIGPMVVQVTVGDKTFRVPYESKGTGRFRMARFRFTPSFRTTRIAFMSLSYITKSDKSGSLCGPVVDRVHVVAL